MKVNVSMEMTKSRLGFVFAIFVIPSMMYFKYKCTLIAVKVWYEIRSDLNWLGLGPRLVFHPSPGLSIDTGLIVDYISIKPTVGCLLPEDEKV